MTIYHTTLRGRVGTGQAADIFTHSLGIDSQAAPSAVANAIRDSWIQVWQAGGGGLDQHYNASTVYEEVTVAAVLDPMVPDLAAAFHVPFTPELPGLGVQETLPQQSAIAVSLTAGLRPNGVPFRGRFYLPAPQTLVVAGDGLLDPTIQQQILTLMSGHFSRLNAAGHAPCIWSRTVEDLANHVDLVRVGNKIDTIRRRRNALPETYVSAVV